MTKPGSRDQSGLTFIPANTAAIHERLREALIPPNTAAMHEREILMCIRVRRGATHGCNPTTASKRRGDGLKGLKDYHMKTKPRIWP